MKITTERSGWGVTQPRSHLSIGTGFPIVVIRFGGLLVRIISRASSIVVLGWLFPVVIATGIRSVRHDHTPRREMRQILNLLLREWFQINLWAILFKGDA